MVAVPARVEFTAIVQDATGDIAVVRFPDEFNDITIATVQVGGLYTQSQAYFSALAACMNGKIVREGFSFTFNRAQKPAGPLSTYSLVQQGAHFNMGDGATERTSFTIPTPLTTDFLADGQTVNPADTNMAALIAAIEANSHSMGGRLFNEYLGGRFRQGKPRRRKNAYNGTA